jgi:hypothetical protein
VALWDPAPDLEGRRSGLGRIYFGACLIALATVASIQTLAGDITTALVNIGVTLTVVG